MTEATRNLLEQHFNTAFAAPGGIAKLRELILTLAMQGKLVEQNPSDPPARELLKEIEAEKERLVKDGKIRHPKPLPSIKREEIPYELPQGWEWVRLGEIMQFINGDRGKNYPSKDKLSSEGIPFISAINLRNGTVSIENLLCVSAAQYQKLGSGKLEKNDLVFCIRGSLGKKAIYPFDIGAIASSLVILRQYLKEEGFLYYVDIYMSSPFIFEEIRKYDNGTAQPNLSANNFMSFLLPLPPLLEQQRIVVRIDQVMARCDEMEKLRAEREQKRLAVHTAAIRQLFDAVDGSAWEFIQQHFNELYAVKDNVAELRKTILQLAVMGRLVPQDPNDPPASELLKQIEAEKQRLVKAGKIKPPKPLPPIKPEEGPYELPQGWVWVHLQDMFAFVTDGDHQAPPKTEYGVPFLVIGNLNTGKVNFERCRYVHQDYYESLDWGKKPTKNDILYSVTGSYGIPIQVDGDDQFCVQRHVAILKSLTNTPFQYIGNLLKSIYAFNYATSIATGIAQKTVPLLGLRRMLVALPPAKEQHRIVARIDQLMALCDALDQQIDVATGKQSELLNAIMAQV